MPMFIAVTFRNTHFLPKLVSSVFDHGEKMRENAKREKPLKKLTNYNFNKQVQFLTLTLS